MSLRLLYLVFVRLCGWLVLSEKILFGELRAGQIVTVGVQGTGPQAQFTFEGVAKPEAVPDAPPAVI